VKCPDPAASAYLATTDGADGFRPFDQHFGSWAIPSLYHATSPVAAQPLSEVIGSRHSPAVATSYVGLELRPLGSTGITRLQRYYGPIRHPMQPSLTVTGLWLVVTCHHRTGLPVFRQSPPPRMPTPLPRRNQPDAIAISSGGNGLPQMSDGSASAIVFSRPAQRSLTFRPACSLDHPR